MALDKWVRKFTRKERIKPTKDMYVLKTDTRNTANILARARDSVQVKKVTTAVHQIEQIWTKEEERNLIKIMLMIDATYPHFEKMADLDVLSEDWLSELIKAMEIATEGADQLLKEQEEVSRKVSRMLDEIEKRSL